MFYDYKFILYKYRFFGYIIIGILSLFIELVTYNFLSSFQNNQILNSFLSVLTGIFTSFWLNVKYNFKISKSKIDRYYISF